MPSKLFLFEDSGADLPVPVFSSMTPHDPVPFLLHVMLTLGEFDTELDPWMHQTMRESLVAANLVDNEFCDAAGTEKQMSRLICLVVQNVFAVQPMTIR